MEYLLDTNILLWWFKNPRILSNEVEDIIRSGVSVFVSSVSTWEIVIKRALGKLKVADTLFSLIEAEGFIELPVMIEHTKSLAQLPPLHNDPFDRLLVAQARVEELIFITGDQAIRQYDLPIIFNKKR